MRLEMAELSDINRERPLLLAEFFRERYSSDVLIFATSAREQRSFSIRDRSARLLTMP